MAVAVCVPSVLHVSFVCLVIHTPENIVEYVDVASFLLRTVLRERLIKLFQSSKLGEMYVKRGIIYDIQSKCRILHLRI